MDDLRRWALAAAPDCPVEENACVVTEPGKPHLPNRQRLPLGFTQKHTHTLPLKELSCSRLQPGLKTTQVFNQKALNISESFVCGCSLARCVEVHLLRI